MATYPYIQEPISVFLVVDNDNENENDEFNFNFSQRQRKLKRKSDNFTIKKIASILVLISSKPIIM